MIREAWAERIWKEAAVVCSMQYSDICLEGLSEETQKPLIALANERPRFEMRIL
jgi:hypothetical protein